MEIDVNKNNNAETIIPIIEESESEYVPDEENDEFFEEDAIILPDIASKKVWVKSTNNAHSVEVDYTGFKNLLIWTKPNAEYLCIEPWFGQADNTDSDYDITHKEAIESLEAGKTFNATRVITALEGK